MNTDYDVIVVGAGTMGMAAGYYLSKKNVRTLLIDQFDPPHEMGSHHGETRIIRHALGEGEFYSPLALRAQELWEELEEKSGYELFRNTGVLAFGPKGASFIRETINSAKKHNIPYQLLDHEQIHNRWPGIEAPEGYEGCLEENAGMLYSANCLRAFKKMALSEGAELLTNTKVTGIDADSGTVTTDQGSYSAKKVIVSGGAWNTELFQQLDLQIPMQPTRQTNVWFEPEEDLYRIEDSFPIFFADLPDGEYYGFPMIDEKGVKSGRHDHGPNVDPTTMDRTFGTYPEDEQDPRQFLDRFLPKAAGQCNDGRACMYTRTPDHDFIIDHHPVHNSIVLAGGFSGHGFKYAPVIGEILAELTLTGESNFDLSPFSVTRSAFNTYQK
ncbi:methyltryptophan oxidase [Bacillaceae bacterium JMAK1]|nr:methyltryptophan oxidase [Bacillaceae bacterium JMAK1]